MGQGLFSPWAGKLEPQTLAADRGLSLGTGLSRRPCAGILELDITDPDLADAVSTSDPASLGGLSVLLIVGHSSLF